jgi:hypothetical protein
MCAATLALYRELLRAAPAGHTARQPRPAL